MTRLAQRPFDAFRTGSVGLPPRDRPGHGRLAVTSLPLAIAVVVVCELAVVGGDAEWLSALGKIIARTGQVPAGVPYAAAASDHWHNVTVLAELLSYASTRLAGDRGLLALQVCAVVTALVGMSTDARCQGASRRTTALSLSLLGAGGATGLLIVRVQLFSLALFPLLLLLLRSDQRQPSWRLWLVVPLLALWANLHGAVLVGFAVTVAYLLLARWKNTPKAALGMLLCCSLSLCATPAVWHTPRYFMSLLSNESAQQSTGLWARLSLSSPFDLALLLALAVLAVGLWRARPAVWELAALLGLTILTANAARSGLWLLLMAAPTAAAGLTTRASRLETAVPRGEAVVTAAALAGLAVGCIWARAVPPSRADHDLLKVALPQAGGGVIASEGVAAERLAVEGGCLWMANPLDAFSHRDQRVYLAWLGRGNPRQLPRQTRAVVVRSHSAAAARLATSPAFRLVERSPSFDLYVPMISPPHGGPGCPGQLR